jgi:hypothetical protein
MRNSGFLLHYFIPNRLNFLSSIYSILRSQYCKSEDDCDDGQCCLKCRGPYRLGVCRPYLEEGDKCYKV